MLTWHFCFRFWQRTGSSRNSRFYPLVTLQVESLADLHHLRCRWRHSRYCRVQADRAVVSARDCGNVRSERSQLWQLVPRLALRGTRQEPVSVSTCKIADIRHLLLRDASRGEPFARPRASSFARDAGSGLFPEAHYQYRHTDYVLPVPEGCVITPSTSTNRP